MYGLNKSPYILVGREGRQGDGGEGELEFTNNKMSFLKNDMQSNWLWNPRPWEKEMKPLLV